MNTSYNKSFLRIRQHQSATRAILPGDCLPQLRLVFCLLDVAALHGIVTIRAAFSIFSISYRLRHTLQKIMGSPTISAVNKTVFQFTSQISLFL
jgi:hypothetical protein